MVQIIDNSFEFIINVVIVVHSVKIFPKQIWLYGMHYRCFIADCTAMNKCSEQWIYNKKSGQNDRSRLF